MGHAAREVGLKGVYVCSDCLSTHRTLIGLTGCCCPAADGDED
jgi:hypothetical protein